METNMIIYIILTAIGAGLGMAVYQKAFKTKGNFRMFAIIASIALLVYGSAGIAVTNEWMDAGGMSGVFFTTTGVSAPIVNGVPQAPVVVGAKQRPISTLSVISTAKNSNSHTTIEGDLDIFDPATNPADPTASALDSISVAAGVGSTTNKYIKTSTPYRVVFDGEGTYYDKDYGVITFPDEDFNPSTGEYLFDMETITVVATIDDMLNESGISGLVNGQTAHTDGTTELFGNETLESVIYDESVGDGQFYIQPTLSASSAYAELHASVACFEWDTSTPPEGNEYSSIVYQLQSGTDFGMPSELVNYWAAEECIALGDVIAGTSSTIKLTFTLDETALDDGADIWYFGFDDLGSMRGKDVSLDTGATLDRIKFDSQA